jgi:hypothetical protein
MDPFYSNERIRVYSNVVRYCIRMGYVQASYIYARIVARFVLEGVDRRTLGA